MHIKATKDFPVCIITSRQNISAISKKPNDFSLGAYIVNQEAMKNQVADLTIVASGSEVALAINAAVELKRKHNLNIKVISCFNLNLFLEQDKAIKASMLESKHGILVIEASNDTL